MASKQRFLSVIIFAINVYTASCYHNGSPDFVIPIPEVTVTIGGSVSSIPVEYEELIVPIVFDPVQNFPPNYQPNFQPTFNSGYQSYPPPVPPVIVLDDGNKNDMSMLFLLLLLGNFNNGGNNNNCNGGCYPYYYNSGLQPRSVY